MHAKTFPLKSINSIKLEGMIRKIMLGIYEVQ